LSSRIVRELITRQPLLARTALAMALLAIPAALLEHPRSLFTPHLGSAVVEVRRQIAMQAATALAEFFAGRPMPGRL
jgi:lactate dehydrogenase-like 2-hydroxyacid dehydrogenase